MADLAGVARVVLIAVFFVAGWAKLGDRSAARTAVRDFGVPDRLAPAVGTILPFAEVTVAVMLAVSATARIGAGVAGALLLAFTVGIATNLARGNRPACNCFGQVHNAPIGPLTLVRNLVLLGVATVIVVEGPGHFVGSWIERATGVAAVAVGATIVAGVLGWFVVNLTAQQGQLMVRLEQLEAMAGVATDRPGHAHDHQSAAAPVGLPVGSVAPAIEATSIDGTELSLQALTARGASVVVVFSSATCAACLHLLPEVAEWDVHHAARLSFLLIGSGDVEINSAKFRAAGVRHAIAEEHDRMAAAYRYHATPAAVLVSAGGRIASEVAVGSDAIRQLVGWASAAERTSDRSHR